MEQKRVSIFVAGQRFTVLTDEEEKYVIDIAAKIDAHITSLTISQNITRERAAVLTALDFADDNEQDKRAIAEIKEQIKDYLVQISTLSDENTALNAENNQLKRKIALLKEGEVTHEADEKEKEALRAQIRALKEQMDLMNLEKTPEIEPVEEQPAPPAAPEEKEEATVTAEDDLFFSASEEPAVKPKKEKKNRHDHNHINPYKQQFMQKKNEQKGYTQQRQYSLFDKDE